MENISNKRIAKNTVFLYIRMLLVMVVTLYTSRVILHLLGISDYGIYNVVGGIVTVMAFVNSALGASTSRFLTYDLGTGDYEQLKKTFAATLNLHLCVSILVIILGETVGLWLFYNKLTIPAERMPAAFFVYQFSIITTCINFTQVPYNASLISHENMSIYAYVGIYEAFSKLLIAFLIKVSPIDNLIFYSALLMINSLIIQTIYRLYTKKKYEECRFQLYFDKTLYKKLLSYSMWDMFGGLATVCQGQGINIVLNMFFGPVVNAARAIALQVQSGISVFITNFMVASRPQVIKSCAKGDYQGMYKLTFYTAKFSFFLMLALMLPICFEMDFILHIWLGNNVPDNTKIFTIIILLTSLVSVFHSAALMPYHAIGRIRLGNSVNGSLMILSLPISYLLLRRGFPAYSVFLVIFIINTITQLTTWIIIHHYVKFSYRVLIFKVYVPCIFVTCLSLIVPIIIIHILDQSWLRFVLLFVLSEIFCFIFLWSIGLDKKERKKVKSIIKKILCKS